MNVYMAQERLSMTDRAEYASEAALGRQDVDQTVKCR